jgi:hypothetical protein
LINHVGVHSPYAGFKDDPELKVKYSLKNAADAAGFYNDLMLDALAEDKENQRIAFAHSSPGFVDTNISASFPWIIRLLYSPSKLFATSPADCAEFLSDFLLSVEPANGFHAINHHGDSAAVTKMHTPEAKAFIKEHTLAMIAKSQSY